MHGTYIKVEDKHDEVVSQFHHNCESDYLLHNFYQARYQNDYCFANAQNKFIQVRSLSCIQLRQVPMCKYSQKP